MRKYALAALVAFNPATTLAFVPMADIGQQVRAVSSSPVMEVGCKSQKNCRGKNRGSNNWVGINQGNEANVNSRSQLGSRNGVYIDQRNQADVGIDAGQNSQNDVYIYQRNKANVHIR